MTPIVTAHCDLLKTLMAANHSSKLNEKLFDEHLNLKKIFPALEKGKIAKDILILENDLETFVIGDIHADEESVENVLKTTQFIERYDAHTPVRLIFLGDYVDRGKKHLETLYRILSLKAQYPDYVYLLKGNHDGGVLQEDGSIVTPYRIPEEDNPLHYFPHFLKNYLELHEAGDLTLLKLYLKWFDTLPITAFIGTTDSSIILECVHGGIPKPDIQADHPFHKLKRLSDLTHRTQKDELGHTTPDLLIWSDPHQGEQDMRLHLKRFKFTEAQYDAYAETIGIDGLLRGHQVVKDGLQPHFGGKVHTIFSSGHSSDTYYTHVSPKIVHLDTTLKLSAVSIVQD